MTDVIHPRSLMRLDKLCDVSGVEKAEARKIVASVWFPLNRNCHFTDENKATQELWQDRDQLTSISMIAVK